MNYEPGDLMCYPCKGSYIYEYFFEVILKVQPDQNSVEVMEYSKTHSNFVKAVRSTKTLSSYDVDYPNYWLKL